MMTALLAPAAATAVALMFSVALARQWRARRRPHALAWTISLSLFALGTAAITLGVSGGWNPVIFGAYWISGALLTVPFLAVGQLHLLVPRLAAAWWVVAGAFTVAAITAMAVTPADGGALEASASSIPTGAQVYGDGAAIALLTPANAMALIVVAGSLWSAVQTRRWGVLLIALGVVVAGTSFAAVRVGEGALTSVLLACGVTIMYGGFLAATRPSRRRGLARATSS